MSPFHGYQTLLQAFAVLRTGPGASARRAHRALALLASMGEWTIPASHRESWARNLDALTEISKGERASSEEACESALINIADSFVDLAVALCAPVDEWIRVRSLDEG